MAGVSKEPYKIFNDPIHDSIEMHPYLVRIIDTPEFQRLRYIRQMGSVYFVYPGASHNRFEHSIGVAHLAGELVQELNKRYDPGENIGLDKKLQEIHEERKKELTTKYEEELEQLKQLDASSSDDQGSSGHQGPGPSTSKPKSELREQCKLEEEQQVLITKDEGLCVQIAALCHDLGHGPFSHLFDGLFIQKVKEKLSKENEKDKLERLTGWTHEKQSIIMLEELIKNIKRRHDEKEEEDNVEYNEFITFMTTHLAFIKELIDPPKELKKHPKTFLYEIVSNKRNGIDVDKMDYFARDCNHLGIESNFNCRRFFKFARVCVCNGEMQICMRDKEVRHIYDLYQTRNNIHHKACQHKVVSAIDTMIVDALLLADKALDISGSVLEVKKYRELTDAIYQNILNYEKIKCKTEDLTDIKKAQEILQRIERRDLYKCVYNSHLMVAEHEITNKRQCEQEIEELSQVKYASQAEEFAVRIINMDSGMKGEDPINHVKFYSKQDPCTAKNLERKDVSRLLPEMFSETVIHIFCKNSEMRDDPGFTDIIRTWLENKRHRMPSEESSAHGILIQQQEAK